MAGVRGELYCTVDRSSEIHHSPFKLDCCRPFALRLLADHSIDELFNSDSISTEIDLRAIIVEGNHLKRRS